MSGHTKRGSDAGSIHTIRVLLLIPHGMAGFFRYDLSLFAIFIRLGAEEEPYPPGLIEQFTDHLNAER